MPRQAGSPHVAECSRQATQSSSAGKPSCRVTPGLAWACSRRLTVLLAGERDLQLVIAEIGNQLQMVPTINEPTVRLCARDEGACLG